MSKNIVMPLADWQDILDSVRAKTGKTDTLVSSQVSSEIDSITGGGGNNDAVLKIVDRTITKLTANDLSGITKIGDYAFYGCLIAEAEIPDTVTSLGRNCFQGNTFERFVIPDSVTSMSLYVFQRCTNLKEVIIGKNVTGFGNGVFDGCTGLTFIDVPDSVKSIAWYTFQNCTNLAKLKLGRGVTSISGCFSGCNNLKEIIILAETPPKLEAQNLSQLPADCIFKVLPNSVEAYKAATNWSARADYIIALTDEEVIQYGG